MIWRRDVWRKIQQWPECGRGGTGHIAQVAVKNAARCPLCEQWITNPACPGLSTTTSGAASLPTQCCSPGSKVSSYKSEKSAWLTMSKDFTSSQYMKLYKWKVNKQTSKKWSCWKLKYWWIFTTFCYFLEDLQTVDCHRLHVLGQPMPPGSKTILSRLRATSSV